MVIYLLVFVLLNRKFFEIRDYVYYFDIVRDNKKVYIGKYLLDIRKRIDLVSE